jgi:soluble lytic murein transglycosylase-like protein/tetratricopeptide (TPR) repeat protein
VRLRGSSSPFRPAWLVALAWGASLACQAPPAAAAETWISRRHEWLAARAAESDARWSGTSASIESAARGAATAESLYVAALESWALSAGRSTPRKTLPPELAEAVLDLIEHQRVEAARALLEGPARDDRSLLPVRAWVAGLGTKPDSGLALLGWPPDRPRGARLPRWDLVAKTASDEADAAYLVAASLAESTGIHRSMRAALWHLARHRDTRQAYARLRLARALSKAGEHRLAAEILAGAVLHDDEERLLLVDLRADMRLELADTSGAAAMLIDVTRATDFGAAQRVAAARRVLPWLKGARVDSLEERVWLDFVRSLGDLGETESGLQTLRRRKTAAPDSAATLARAETEAALFARAKRHADAASVFEKLLRQEALPAEKRARYALGVARARRGMGAFASADSAFLKAVALDSLGATGGVAAWERAREWEDRKDAREAARVLAWSRRYLKDPTALRTRSIHEAIAWWRAGEPDSAAAAFGSSTAEFALFWKSRILVARGDSLGAERELAKLPAEETWTYERVRAGEEMAAGPTPGSARSTTKRPPPPQRSAVASTRDPAPLSARVYGAIGATQWMMDELRECAGLQGPRGRACTEALEARGVFRAGRSANVPADRLDYPPAYPEAVLEAARREGLSPSLIWAIMRQESAYQRGVRSKAGAIGLLQLLPATASRLNGSTVTEKDLYDSDTNVRLGARYLRTLLAEFGDARAASAAYNAGEDVVRRWIRDLGPVDDFWVERIPYRETRDYVRQVYTIRKRYERIYGTPPPGGEGG